VRPDSTTRRSESLGVILAPNPSLSTWPTFPPTVDADLVQQADRTDREAEGRERRVDGVDARALVEQATGLVHVGREDSRRVEAGRVVDDDDRLPSRLPYATAVTIASSSVSPVAITSSSGILCTGEKKCIPSTRLGRDDAYRDAAGWEIVLVFDA
jgi:hypothetical protein